MVRGCILFDGALPESKRQVRLERLEKSRQQLEVFRRLYPQLTVKKTAVNSNEGLSDIIWNHITPSTRRQALPAPQLLVSSAIEALLSSNWNDRFFSDYRFNCADIYRAGNL